MNPTANSRVQEPVRRWRHVSPTYVFVVTTVSALLVLAVVQAHREIRYVSRAMVKLSQRDPTTDQMPSADELLESVRTRYESTGAAAAVSVAPSPDRTAFEVSATSNSISGVTDRLNEATSAWVKRRNEQALAAEETDLTVRRATTARARSAREAAERALHEIDERDLSGLSAPPALVSIAPLANPANPIDQDAATAPSLPNDPEATRRATLQRDAEVAAAALSALQQRLTDAHPDVQHAQAHLADLQTQLAALPPPASGQRTPTADVSATIERPDGKPSRPAAAVPLAADQTNQAQLAQQLARQHAQAALAAANLQLEDALKAEGTAARSYATLAANPMWLLEPAISAVASPVGKTEAPWLIVVAASVALGTIASMLACGLRPTVDTAEDAVAIFAAPIVGTIPAEGPLPPPVADPGVVGAQWIARCGLAMVMLVLAITIWAAASSGMTMAQLENDPLSVFAMPREWLAAHLS